MTAMNVIKRHDEITVITDGAGYDQHGRLLSIDSKVELLPHYPGFVMQSGGSAWTPAIVAMFGFFAPDTDALFEKVEWVLPLVVEKFEGISQEPMGRVIFGGWSNSQQQMRLGVVFSEEAAALKQDSGGHAVIQPDAFTLQEFEGDQLLAQPPVSEQHWNEGFGGRVYDLKQITDVDAFASFMLVAQRTVGAPFRGVGGFGQITSITRSAVSARVFERYDDEIGDIMMPIVVDWAARRAERIPAGLSRLQRERMEKKARKGTLRAV